MTFEPLRVAMGPLQRAAARVSDFFFYLRDNTPLTQEDVLREEGRAIRDSDVGPDLTGLSGKELNRALNARNSVALCLFGGGIRSASFALGIIQALAVHPRAPKTNHVSDAEICWLAQVRYLSTVSGGGYIGGWLSTWLFHAHGDVGGGWNAVWKGLVNERDDPINEPKEISWLRRYSNFLTPKLGITSADTWAAATLIVRNLLLNWLIIVPVLAAALLILKLLAIAVAWVSQINAISSGVVFWPLLIVGCLCLILCLRFTTKTRPTRGPSKATRSEFLWRDLLPAALAAVFFTLSLAAADAEYYVHSGLISMGQMQARGLLILMGAGALVYAAGWIVAFAERASFWDFVAWVLSGALYGALLATGLYLYFNFAQSGWWIFKPAEVLLLICGLPWALLSQLLSEMIFVGLASYQNRSDSDREWLGRAAGWYLVLAIVWFLLMTLVFLGSGLAIGLYAQVKAWLLAGGAGSVTAFLSKSRHSPAQGEAKGVLGISFNVVLAIAAVVTGAALVVGVSGLLDNIIFGQSLVSSSSFHQAMSESGFPPWPGGIWVPIALVVSAFIAAVASWRVNINRFSMHALYRNRLIRAFLGASNHNRKPNPFTGFDEDDNIRAYDLWVQQTSNNTWPKVGAQNWRPFHVVNIALNVVSTQNLAWQERKAEPFIVSPLHSGGSCVGYRYSSLYGDSNGISLGTAIAISGAAASPNMGYHSSPTLTFLMALFNVRLGWWLGNPGPKGANTYQADGPKQAIVPLLYEMFGLTTEKWKYIYLSDGGHFENLGLYEMVRRRCRFIIVSDAGCDPTYAFDDLGNAVRKISLDLGVDIRFYGLTELRPRQAVGSAKTGDVPKAENPDQPFYAIGVIDYPTADGGGEQGIIVYVKAGYHRHRIFNVGVRNYATANPDFPHQTTGDQFFSESQFESYRSLGFEIMDDILARGAQLSADPSNPKFKDVVTALRDKAVRDGRP